MFEKKIVVLVFPVFIFVFCWASLSHSKEGDIKRFPQYRNCEQTFSQTEAHTLTALKSQAQIALNREITLEEASAISRAHHIGIGERGRDGQNSAAVENYTPNQLLRKIRILAKHGGFNRQERDILVRQGVVGVSDQEQGKNPLQASYEVTRESLERLIRQVVWNKKAFLGLSSCGENCFQMDSTMTDLPRIIQIDSSLSFPLQEGHILRVPPLNEIDDPFVLDNMIRRLLVGHELHPYVSTPFPDNTLRPSQQMAIEAFRESLESGYDSFLHVAPTGTGKGLVLARNLIEKLRRNPKKISFITVDKVKIVDQLVSEIQYEAQGADFNLRQIHWIAAEGKDFIEEIRQSLSSEKPTVINLTVKSFLIQMENLKNKNPFLYEWLLKNLDAIYIDEVHHLGAPRTLEFILDLKEKTQAFIYGTTATPVHEDVEIQDLFQKIHWSYMDEFNFDTYPSSIVVDQLGRSIERGDITPFNDVYILLGEDIPTTTAPFFIQRGESHLFSINPYYYDQLMEIVSSIFESNKKGMIIASTIKEAEDLASFFNREFIDITFETYHSNLKPELQEAVFENSRAEEAHYIIAVRALDEGVNLPHLSAYIDLNPHVSVKQMVHRIGRVLRPALNKLKADILILSSYRNFETTKELMNSVRQIRERTKNLRETSRETPFSPARKRLRNLAARSHNLFLRQEQFWSRTHKDQENKTTNRENKDSLDTYFHYLSEMRKQFPPLSQDEQTTLFIEFRKTGDNEIRNEIVSHNLGLVATVVNRYTWALSPVIDIMDLFQEGSKGLIAAVEAHKPESEYRFSTLAIPYIEGYIKRFCFEQAHMVRIKHSSAHNTVFFNLERQKSQFFSQNEDFDAELVAENLSTDKIKVKPETVEWMDNHLSQDLISFNQPFMEQENLPRLAEDHPNPEGISAFEEIYDTDTPLLEDVIVAEKVMGYLIKVINGFLTGLSPRQRDVFQRRFLIDPPIVYAEIGKIYGVTGGYIQQIARKLERRFRHPRWWDVDSFSLFWLQSKLLDSSSIRNLFTRDLDSYTESVFGQSFSEYFYSFSFERNSNSEKVLDFFEKTVRSFLSRLSALDKDIFQRFLTTHPISRIELAKKRGVTVKYIQQREIFLLYELKYKIIASSEDPLSLSISQFKSYLSNQPFIEYELKYLLKKINLDQ